MFRTSIILFLFLAVNFAFGLDNFNIEKVASAFISTCPQDYNVVGDFVYCADEYGLSIWDISEAEEPVKVGQCATRGYTYRLDVSGQYAYLSEIGKGICVVDISDPRQPEIVSQLDFYIHYSGVAPDLVIHDNHLYIAAGGSGFYVASLEDPRHPEIIGQYRFEDRRISADFVFIENIGYNICSGKTMVLNVENPEEIELINIAEDCTGEEIQLFNDMIVTNSTRYLDFYNLDNPVEPELIHRFELRTNKSNSIVLEDDLIYCADGDDLKIYEFNNRDEPVLLCSLWVDQTWPHNKITFIFKRDNYIYANVER